MHPAAIIIAVLFFGGLWGVWGVFFAIPLATLVQAVINSWPSIQTRLLFRNFFHHRGTESTEVYLFLLRLRRRKI